MVDPDAAFDQRNRFGTKRALSALMEFAQKAFIFCNELAFVVDSQDEVDTIISGMVKLD